MYTNPLTGTLRRRRKTMETREMEENEE